jgi:hypothetical protein
VATSPGAPGPAGPPQPGQPGKAPGGRQGRGGGPENPAITHLKELAATIQAAAAGAPERGPALQELMQAIHNADPAIAAAAAEILARLGRHGSLTPDDAAVLAQERESLPAEHPARAGLAGAVAAAWAKDGRLGPWLDALATAAEPASQRHALNALDKTTSEPFRAFVLRLTKETKDPAVLDECWDEDRMYAAVTRENAARLSQAIDVRLQEATLPRETRGLGFYALGLAAVSDPDAVAPILARRAAAETDPVVLALAREMAALVAKGEANVASLEEIWDRLRDSLKPPKPAPAPGK